MNDPQADPGGTIETDAAARSAFQALLKLLRIPVPLVAALSLALILGAKTVEIGSFTLSQIEAAFASIIILLVVYLGCYRAALTLLRLIEQQGIDKSDSLRLHMLTETSIHNPFSRSERFDSRGESSISDYVGLVAIHVPVMIVLITSMWAIAELPRALELTQEAAAILDTVETDDSVPMEERRRRFEARDPATMEVIRKIGTATQRLSVASRIYFAFWFHAIGVWSFVFLYGGFLHQVANISELVNKQDVGTRERILFIPFSLSVVVLLIVHGIVVIAMIRAAIDSATGS